MTLTEIEKDYLEVLRVRGLAADTVRSHAVAVRRFLREANVQDIREVTWEQVRAYAADLHRHGKYQVSTVRVWLVGLKSFFAWLEARDVLFFNPCERLPLPKERERLPRTVLTMGEVKKVLAVPEIGTPQGKRDRAILEVLYSTGLRREEMQRLTVADLDLFGGFIRVGQGKGGRGRVVPVGAVAVAALQDYLPIRRQWLQNSLAPVMTFALWLSPLQPHHPLQKEAIALLVRRCARRAGIGRSVGPHLWRHTCATHWLNQGGNIVHVQKLLGHARLTTTAIYTRVSIRDLKKTHRRKHPRSLRKQRAA